jgi:hypothetical protein
LDYLAVAKIDLKILLPFPATYECEVCFPILLQIETIHRDRLSVEDDLQCAPSSTSPKNEETRSRKVSATSPLDDFLTPTVLHFHFFIRIL